MKHSRRGRKGLPSKPMPVTGPTPWRRARRCWNSRLCWTLPPTTRPASKRRSAPHRVVALSAVAALVVTLAPGCAPSPSPQANAANPGRQIDTRTPPGIRAQQTLDMLNSDWPIGPVGVGTLAAPKMANQIQTMMEKLWWDRPFTFHGVDLKAGAATLQLTTSYGAQQEIRIHTADDTMVDGFDVTTLAPKISSWRDVDTVLRNTGARYSWQVPKDNDGHGGSISGAH